MSRYFEFCLLNFALCIAACAPKQLVLPSDAGVPLAEVDAIHNEVAAACSGVRTLTAEIALSGRAGPQKIRGRVHAGFARPASMRLEGVAPFGAPAFILAARGDDTTLLLPRDDRVLRGAAPGEVLGALTGVALAPADVQAILTGCVTPLPRATSGATHGKEWASIALDGGATLFLRRAGTAWQVRAARRGPWQIEYDAWQGGFPGIVRLRSKEVDLAAEISQLETNVDLDASAFDVNVPRAALPLTLEELRQIGPLRGAPGETDRR
jgi:outer membrane lipoprotein-sorting protein